MEMQAVLYLHFSACSSNVVQSSAWPGFHYLVTQKLQGLSSSLLNNSIFLQNPKCLLGQLAANSSTRRFPWVERLSSVPGASPQSTQALVGSC